MATSIAMGERKPWWITNKKIADKHVKEARAILTMGTKEQGDVASALNLLEAALSLYPRLEPALELKARTLLFQRRYTDVADMLKDYIPTLASHPEDSAMSSSLKVLVSPERERSIVSIKCFDFKRKFVHISHTQGHWRYLVLGQACLHLGLMEDAILLLQSGKRLATASHRRSSTSLPDDIISLSHLPITIENSPPPPVKTEIESISPLITHIKQLLHRKTAALAAFDAGLYSESIRHFSKILVRGGPQAFLVECYIYRATAYKSINRIADSIADCNKALSLDPSSIKALTIRASLSESINCLPDSLHNLEHLKLLFNSVLRDKKLPGPSWKRPCISYREIPAKLCALSVKIKELKVKVSKGETNNVDYYALMGLRRGCSRSELNKAYLLLALRHKPERSNGFIERCEFADEKDVSSVRERAKMSALLLYRLVQKSYTNVMAMVSEEEAVEKQRVKAVAALQAAMKEAQQIALENEKQNKQEAKKIESKVSGAITADLLICQGFFCRDIAVVGNLLSQTGFNCPIPIKYEAC